MNAKLPVDNPAYSWPPQHGCWGAPLSSRKVLVVDDDADVREAVTQLLTAAGHEVRTATDGADALGSVTGGFVPDVVVLDLLMPVMDGASFLEALQQQTAVRPRLVVLTAVRSHHVKWLLGVDE